MTNTFDFYVYPRETDASKRISLQSIGAFILDAAGLAAKARGFGMEYMHAHGFGNKTIVLYLFIIISSQKSIF